MLFLRFESSIILKEWISQFRFNKFFQLGILEMLLMLGKLQQSKNNFPNILNFCKTRILISKILVVRIVLFYKNNPINLYFIIKKKESPKLKKANILNLISILIYSSVKRIKIKIQILNLRMKHQKKKIVKILR